MFGKDKNKEKKKKIVIVIVKSITAQSPILCWQYSDQFETNKI
jgi:hypothetical protein